MSLLNSNSQLKKAELVVGRCPINKLQVTLNCRFQCYCHIAHFLSAFGHPTVNMGTAHFWAELMHTHMHTFQWIIWLMSAYTHAHTCIHTCTHIHIYAQNTHVYTHMCIYMHIYVYTHAHMYMHIYVPTCTHTHTHPWRCSRLTIRYIKKSIRQVGDVSVTKHFSSWHHL